MALFVRQDTPLVPLPCLAGCFVSDWLVVCVFLFVFRCSLSLVFVFRSLALRTGRVLDAPSRRRVRVRWEASGAAVRVRRLRAAGGTLPPQLSSSNLADAAPSGAAAASAAIVSLINGLVRSG